MKYNNCNITAVSAQLLQLVVLVLALGSCSGDDDIIFDHERAAFPTQADKILLEAIVPSSTTADEDIYIVGPFNGLDDASVIGNSTYKLTPSEEITQKRGIYLDPSAFVSGKTLSDGYHFVSSVQRNEVTVLGDTVIRTESPAPGTRTNLYISQWAAHFDPAPVEPTHDGFTVYVDNQTSWGDAITVYMWGDVNDLNGGWPGMTPTGKQTKDGVEYTYFDMGDANAGLTEHLIFSNNGAGQLADFTYTIDHDVYLRITDTGVEEIGAQPVHDGYTVFVDNQSGWDALYLYQWGDVNDLNGSWPGATPTGTQVVNGVTYTYFDMGAANNGLKQNLIFNNGNGKQLADFSYTIDHDVYLKITESEVKELK